MQLQLCIFKTKCPTEGDVIVMNIEAFEHREAMLDLREKLLLAEQQRLAGEPTISLKDAHKQLKDKISAK